MMIDPPSGWKWGFPKPFTFDASPYETKEEKDQAEREWFIANGYPASEIDLGMLRYCRMWETEINIDMGDPSAR